MEVVMFLSVVPAPLPLQESWVLSTKVKFPQHKINQLQSVQFSGISYIHSVIQHPPLSGSKHFIAPRETLDPLSGHSPFPHFATNQLFDFMGFPILDISYK